ncbi:hypothetical protein D3C84_1274090 [compost metagenome]
MNSSHWLVEWTSSPAREIGAGTGGTVTRSHLATHGKLVPCKTSETRTMKKARLKYS